MAALHTLKRTTSRSKRRIGRGQSSGRGKTAGRGTKGQSARAGNKKRPELRDIIKKIPKRRGYGKNRGRTVVPRENQAINLDRLEALYAPSEEVSLKSLADKGLVTIRRGERPAVKIIGNSAVSKKLVIRGIAMTASARAAIEKAGGSIA